MGSAGLSVDHTPQMHPAAHICVAQEHMSQIWDCNSSCCELNVVFCTSVKPCMQAHMQHIPTIMAEPVLPLMRGLMAVYLYTSLDRTDIRHLQRSAHEVSKAVA